MWQTPVQNHSTSKLSYTVLILLMILIWFSLVLQFYISIPAYIHNGRSLPGTLVQLFSYFTIQTNLLAGLCLGALLLKPSTTLHRFFSRGYVFTGIVLYITIVGLVYNIILRSLWHPTGLFRVADELLHSVNPLLFVTYWLIFVPKERLKWAQALNWLWFPFLYLIYVLIRGAITHLYPYPFIDAGQLGYFSIIINALLLLVVFLLLGLLLILLTRSWIGRTHMNKLSTDTNFTSDP
jgi:hypothetical protein